MKMNYVLNLLGSTVCALLLAGCDGKPAAEHDETDSAHAHAHGHGAEAAEHAEEAPNGPHGGRLLEQDGHAVELAIVEDGVPPHYRAWLSKEGKPATGQLQVTLKRLGGPVDVHRFAPAGDFLTSEQIVTEPHSFDVEVEATIGDKALHWDYESHEGRTRIAADIAAQSGIQTAAVGPGVIADAQDVQGILTPVEGRHARVVARFPGPIKSVKVGVGDRVKAGQTLATVESNVSLSDYPITAPFAGTVMQRNAGVGDLAGDQPLFEIADLSKLWVDLHLFGPGAQLAAAGLAVEVTRLTDGSKALTTLDRVLPGTATASQSTIARATLDNTDGAWRPGSAVQARITIAQTPVELLVPLAALQNFRDWEVAFIQVGEEYEIRPLTLGRRDAVHVEVLEGLKSGDQVVVQQSYLIKADIEKSGASHDH